MPYTLSHVAAVVPVSRWLLRLRVLSAAVIGSLVPDFGYLLPNHLERIETHSRPALVTFCLPVGLLSYWIFQRLLKAPLVSVLPDRAYMRWRPHAAPASWTSVRQWLLAACGVLAGATVHLAWDAFTHEDGRGVRMVPELSDPLLIVHGHLVSGALLLQGLSSVLGLAVVAAAIAYALRGGGNPVVTPRALTASERRAWVLGFAIAVVSGCVGFFMLEYQYGGGRWLGVGTAAIALLRAVVTASLCVGLLLAVYLRTRRGATP
jgi:Domain of unknown function (DUF4184)